MLSDSFEKPSFFSLFVIGLAHALSGLPHFMSTISTIWVAFLSDFSLLGVLSKVILSEPSIGIRWVLLLKLFTFRVVSGLLWPMPLRQPLLLASSNDFLACSFLGVGALQGTETGIVLGLPWPDADACGDGFIDSISLVIRSPMVPVVPTLIDPPPPLIASSFWTMFLYPFNQKCEFDLLVL